MKVILASASPRRKELLSSLFDNIECIPQNVKEESKYVFPEDLVMDLAAKKMNKLNEQYPDDLVISADTVVFYRNRTYGKPGDISDSYYVLQKLSNHVHQVYTGVCVSFKGKIITFYEKSNVKFKNLTFDHIKKYVQEKKPYDKAGSYAIQDNEVVESYDGSYSNIVGLPLEKLKEVLTEIGAI